MAEVADRLGLSPTIAYVNGDDLMERVVELAERGDLRPFGAPDADLGDPTKYLTANAYLGCFGIVNALAEGADILSGKPGQVAARVGHPAWNAQWKLL